MGASITTAAVYGPWTEIKFRSASIMGKAFQYMDPETAHDWAIWAAENNFLPKDFEEDPKMLHVTLWGREFRNPIGPTNPSFPF